MILSNDEFGALFETFQKSACRVETLDSYIVDGEEEQFAAYLKGQISPIDHNEAWASMIKSIVDSGRYIGRVHIISRDISPYVRFETDWYYAFNATAGDDIRFIFRDEVPPVTFTDTWLFDDEIVVDMSYTSEGNYLYANRNDDPHRLEQAREAWKQIHDASFDLATFLGMCRSARLSL